MTKKTVPDLKELFKQAAEIAQQVPENMQEAAFNRALEMLTRTEETEIPHQATPQKISKRVIQSPEYKKDQKTESIESLIENMDSTQHPGVTSATKVLDRALMILQIALSEHNVDGLSPGEIAKILTEKFRISTTPAAVRMTIGTQTTLVNRVKRGQGYIYRIMGPGEDYLAHLKKSDVESTQTIPPQTQETARKKKITTTKKKTIKKKNISKGTAKSPIGPKAAIVELVNSGFFSESKTGPEVQEYLSKKRGFSFGTDSLRFTMLRLVRDGLLERDENDKGSYEYVKAKT